MNFNPFSFFTKTKSSNLSKVPIVERLKIVATENNFYLFENITIYHNFEQITIPLLVLDRQNNIYLFEFKQWSIKDLKNSTIKKTINKRSKSNNLAFNEKQKFIKKRLNEVCDCDEIQIFNFLLIEKLSSQQYMTLDPSVQDLLPQNQIIFNDLSEDEIFQKLTTISTQEEPFQNNTHTSYLFIQYMILSQDEKNVFLASKEQLLFLNADLKHHIVIHAPEFSGKSNVLLLKAIFEKLKNPELDITIISPTALSCDLMKQKLLHITELAHVAVDITAIEIIPPTTLINKHLSKLHKPLLEDQIYIDNTLMSKNFKAAKLIMCDDADILPNDFIAYLIHIQKNDSLVLISNNIILKHQYSFTKTFLEKKPSYLFIKSDPYANALHIISKLLQEHSPQEISVISTNLTREKLYDDLKFFIEDKASLLNSSLNLLYQELDNLLLSTYEQINTKRVNFILLLDICSASMKELEYYCTLGNNSVYLLYEQECEEISILKDKFASKKN